MIHDINSLGPTLWVLQWFPVLAAVVHAEHKRIQNERHDDGHHHLEREQTKYQTHTVTSQAYFCKHNPNCAVTCPHHCNYVKGHEVKPAPVARHRSDSFLRE